MLLAQVVEFCMRRAVWDELPRRSGVSSRGVRFIFIIIYAKRDGSKLHFCDILDYPWLALAAPGCSWLLPTASGCF